MQRRFLVAILVMITGAVYAQQESSYSLLADAVMELSEALASRVVDLEDGVVVHDFVDLKEETGDFGKYLSITLTTRLAGHPQVRVLERRGLDSIFEEGIFQRKDIVDPESVKEMGKLLGADAVIIGDYFDLGIYVDVGARVISMVTGELLVGARVSIKPDAAVGILLGKPVVPPPPDDPEPPLLDVPLRIAVWTDKQEYRVGESAVIYFNTNLDCYLTLVDFAADGSVFIIYPNRFSRSNRVQGGATYRIPGLNDGYDFRAALPVGVDRLKAVATLEPKEFTTTDFDWDEATFAEVRPEVATRGFEIIATTVKEEERGEAEVVFRIK